MPDVLMNNFTIVGDIVQTMAIIIGLFIFVGGLFHLKRYGEMRTMMSQQMSIAGPLMMLVMGSFLLTLPFYINVFVGAFWGTNNINPMPYTGGPTGYDELIPPILVFVRVVGVVSFVRGAVILSRVGGQHAQPGSTAKGLIHILAGVLLVHILETVELLETLLGFTGF